MFKTSQNGSKKKLWNPQKHLFGTFHRQTGSLITGDSVMTQYDKKIRHSQARMSEPHCFSDKNTTPDKR